MKAEQGLHTLLDAHQPGAALPDEDGASLDLAEYWGSIRRRKRLILTLGGVAALLASLVVVPLPPVYTTAATVLVESDKNKIVKIEEVYAGISQDREHFQTQVTLMGSPVVELRTIRALKLWDYPEYDPRIQDSSWLARVRRAIGLAPTPPTWTEDSLARAILPHFNGNLSITPVQGSQLVKVAVDSTNPKVAADAALSLAENYIGNDRDARFDLSQKANVWLQDRVAGLREKLDVSVKALQTYRDAQGIVSISGSAQTFDSDQIRGISDQLIAARVHRSETESVVNDIRRVKDDDYSAIPGVMANPAVADAKAREAAAESKVAELSQRYGSGNSRLIEATSELASARGFLRRQMQAVAQSLTREYEASRATERSLEAGLARSRGTVQGINRKEAQLSSLERDVQSNRELYELFLGRAKETDLTSSLRQDVARVVDPPMVPTAAYKPRKLFLVGMALALGLILGVVATLLVDYLDSSIKSGADAERRLKLPLLTALPEIQTGTRHGNMRLFLEQPESLFAETVRTARTGILLSQIDTPNKVIMVASSVSGEGKSTLCSNLALAHAQTKRTLLIDADMRRPRLARDLGLEPGAKGLSDLVAGTAPEERCLHAVAGSTMMVMPCGRIPPNPTELLLSQRFRDAIAKLRTRFDIIIIDSPPVELVSDALVVGAQATGVIYVVKVGETPCPMVRRGIARLQRGGATILGVVLSHVDFDKAQRYHGDHSAYADGKYGESGYAYMAPASPALGI